MPAHGAGAGSVSGKSSVHNGKQPGVDILLDHEQVDERVVDNRMCPMPVPMKQSAKGILHRTRNGGEDVCLDGGKLDDVDPDQEPEKTT